VGKLADLALLSKDYLSVPVNGIGDIHALLTTVGRARGVCGRAVLAIRRAALNAGHRPETRVAIGLYGFSRCLLGNWEAPTAMLASFALMRVFSLRKQGDSQTGLFFTHYADTGTALFGPGVKPRSAETGLSQQLRGLFVGVGLIDAGMCHLQLIHILF